MKLESEFFHDLVQSLSLSTHAVLEEIPCGAKALIIKNLFSHKPKSILYISADPAPKIVDDLEFFGCNSLELPQSSELEASADVKGMELKTLSLIKDNPNQIIIGSLQALTRRYVDKQALKNVAKTIHINQNYEFLDLKTLFESMGYVSKTIVQEKGTFAFRGGIVDIFPFDYVFPVRLEFDDQKLISLREFDPVLQTSLKKVTSFQFMGCQSHEKTMSIFDYLTSEPLIIFDGLEDLEEQWIFSQRLQHEQLVLPKNNLLFFAEKPLSQLFADHEDLQNFLHLNLNFQALKHPFLKTEAFFITHSKPSFEELALELPSFLDQGGYCQIAYSSDIEKQVLLKENLNVNLVPGFLSEGFYLSHPPHLVLSYQDFFDQRRIRRNPIRLTSMSHSKEFDAFQTGDVVVHQTQGIGKCLGVEKKVNHLGQEAEYFKLEFAEKAILYVPIKDASLLTRYVGSSQAMPTFSQLGSNRWQKIRAQTQASIIGYAQKLLELAALRKMERDFKYPLDSQAMIQFEDAFPFTATDDQLRAIEAIKGDMKQGVPMDRLICGDVGYGKTEVAMRAAFKAVVDGQKQVAVLVPTTVLAMQHFENFKERMSQFPLSLGILSRFNTQKEIKATLLGLKNGTIDIVIGTHRLLSSDVAFRDLGLMIVDEEQRFGVKAKEALKQLKSQVDCLTLSATPIPRTLYTSIVGMKQMSIIATPPYDRLPVKTILTVTDDQFIRQALLKEIARKGQSYFIHNRVENLPLIYKKIKSMIPEANIGIAHGQMDAEDIDSVFHSFKTGKLDILIATTLVENGVDIPNANTILIDNAHHFGLSDLYQLRGRVGRWNKAATCYLLIPRNHNLDEPTRKRLEAIVSTSGYGGGLKVAMRDLEIRGAGDLLGTEQSGHVSQIGFTLYCKLLKKTICAMQKKQPLSTLEPKIDFPFDAKIPESYVFDLDTRIEFYHRFGDVESVEEAHEIYKEMIDRFGPCPQSVKWLYVLSQLKLFCIRHSIVSVSIQKMTIHCEKSFRGQVKKLTLAVSSGLDPENYYEQFQKKFLEAT